MTRTGEVSLERPMHDGELSLVPLGARHIAGLREACSRDREIWQLYPISFDPSSFDRSLSIISAKKNWIIFAITVGVRVVGMTSYIRAGAGRGGARYRCDLSRAGAPRYRPQRARETLDDRPCETRRLHADIVQDRRPQPAIAARRRKAGGMSRDRPRSRFAHLDRARARHGGVSELSGARRVRLAGGSGAEADAPAAE